MTLGYDTTLFLPIPRVVLFAREIALRAFQPLAFVRKVEKFDRYTVGVVSVLQNTHVDTDTPAGGSLISRVGRQYLDTEDGVPLAGWLLFDGDGRNLSAVGKAAVKDYGNLTEFREPQSGPTACVF